MTPLEEVQAHVLGAVAPLAAVRVPVADAAGCVLAADVVATESVPPFANTGMDGIAVRAADTPGRLRVVGFLPAGADPAPFAVGPGEAVRIMTGAPIPAGADAVVPVEELDGGPEDAEVVARIGVEPGRHVRPAGTDAVPGQVVLAAGTPVTPAGVGVLASLGARSVEVVRRPRVGVLSTGDELVVGGAELRPGQIRESNRPALLARLAADGFGPVDLGIARDVPEEIEAAIEGGLATCDALLTSGGVSMGDVDHVKAVLDRLAGGDYRWFQVAIKPAKPFAFGVVGGTPAFGLPGNPVSSLVSYECFARPALRRLAGFTGDALWRPEVRAVAPDGLPRRPDGKLHLVRVALRRAGAGWEAREAGRQESNALAAMAVADGLALVPDGTGVPAGAEVAVSLL